LAQASCFEHLQQALFDIDLVIGTSAKPRHAWRTVTPAHQLSALLRCKQGSLGKVALVFGCEAAGLSNEQLALCDLVSGIALIAPYPSLNLAQAVMLYAYELRELHLQPAPLASADAQQYAVLRTKIDQLLSRYSYPPDSKLARWAMETLPRADNKAIGFLHSLCDKLLKR
jgi:tRNA/rRNA methyltransferase